MRESELKPQFILVMGGAGSGKNTYISKHFPTYKLVDVDAIKSELGLDAAMAQMKPTMLAAFMNGANVAHPTTGSHLKGQENKIKLAKEHGYVVRLVLIDTPPEVAMGRVRERVRNGGHDVEIDKIVASNLKARENFGVLKNMVDFSEVIRQSVNEDIDDSQPEEVMGPDDFRVMVDHPAKFTPAQMQGIFNLIKSGGQLAATGQLMQRLKKCKKLAVAISGAEEIVGCAAIKVPALGYHQNVFSNATDLDELYKRYPYEMGYKFVLPGWRGKNIGQILSAELLRKTMLPVFATVRAGNNAALTPLQKLGFSQIGLPFEGSSGNQIILLVNRK
jgi:predicted ABC-type ATPase